MRLLANENIPLDAVEALRIVGHDVLWGRIAMPGASDEQVLAAAIAEQRLLVTFDKDFGELAFRARLPAECGIVLFRLSAASAGQLGEKMAATLAARTDWAGRFAVVDSRRIRMRALPTAGRPPR